MIHEDEPIQPSHISYKDYKKMIKRNPKQGAILFLSVFFILLIVFLGFAKLMSPDIDITLGDENVQYEELEQTGAVDSRLMEIHMEDNSQFPGEDGLAIEEGDRVIIPDTKKEHNISETLPAEENRDLQTSEKTVDTKTQVQAPVQNPELNQAPVPQPQQAAVSAKVVVGSYATLEQAQVAKGILADSEEGLNPFIRKVNNEYTIQVGSFNSKEKAVNAAKNLLNKNYPARVLIEQ